MKKKILGILAMVALTVSVVAVPASAIPVVATDYDTLVTGALIAGPMSDLFDVAAPPPATMGTLVSNVYYDGSSIYTYEFTVTPTVDNISEVNTGFNVLGFNGVAGYSFTDATTVGTGFSIDVDFDGTIDFSTSTSGAFDSGEAITFFYQSTIAPTVKDYNATNSEVGTAKGYAPVPEPATLLLIGTGLLGLGIFGRKKIKG